ncbi:olfactory receptor 4P4-like [Tachyglossus aculeatus]|uniref:olfactory receptor 4P4-like n=1 Tax=Tachyglossus aculeatus TaxID=9261 RepID=UPI0018F40B51|nr:olfactory receptor 4P4-like [Tachyglossus aculeatus]
MEKRNNVTEFILLGLSSDRNLQIFCFGLFLSCYIAILLVNHIILITIRGSSLIKHPMYFFLCHLSFMDLCYTSTVTPKLVGDLLSEKKTISFCDCMIQLFTIHFFGGVEIFILVGMAYDRYVAICKPLHYVVIMNKQRCATVVAVCWVGGFLHSIFQWVLIFCLPFCGPNKIDHYFCDVYPLLELACTDTEVVGLLVLSDSGTVALVSFTVLVFSYVTILASLRTRSSEGRHKALSTCTSHIIVVALFFLPSIFIYLRPATIFPEDKVFALFYTIIAPMFNPLIYTLRNREMKTAMRQVWCWKSHLEGKSARHRCMHASDSPKETNLTPEKSEMTRDSETPFSQKQPPSIVEVPSHFSLKRKPYRKELGSDWLTLLGKLSMDWTLLILITVRGSFLIKQPMYFFLCHLYLKDVCYTSTVIPKLIRDLLSEMKTISFGDCMTQLFTMHLFGGVEFFILVRMASDRYVALCKPLHLGGDGGSSFYTWPRVYGIFRELGPWMVCWKGAVMLEAFLCVNRGMECEQEELLSLFWCVQIMLRARTCGGGREGGGYHVIFSAVNEGSERKRKPLSSLVHRSDWEQGPSVEGG